MTIQQQLFSRLIGPGLVAVTGGLTTIYFLNSTAPVQAQSASCNLLESGLALTIELTSVEGQPIALGTFSDGLQAVILANRSTSNQSREVATRLRLEFDRYAQFRRVILIDGTKVTAVEGLVLESLRESASEPNAPLLAADFQGEQIAPFLDVARQTVPEWEASEQALLFILDGEGEVLSLHPLDGSLETARQCLRDQVRQLGLQVS